MSLMKVVFRMLDKAGTGFIEPRREDGHGSSADKLSHMQPHNTAETPLHSSVTNWPEHTGLTNDQLRSSPVSVRDQFASLEILEAQTANADQVLVFNFSAPVSLFYIYSEDHQNHLSHVSIPPNQDPSATYGVPVLPGVPQSFPVPTTTVKVYENNGGKVKVWGYRYG